MDARLWLSPIKIREMFEHKFNVLHNAQNMKKSIKKKQDNNYSYYWKQTSEQLRMMIEEKIDPVEQVPVPNIFNLKLDKPNVDKQAND